MGRFNSRQTWVDADPMVMFVRGVVFANVANLGAFTVASNDGLTYVEGDRVLLANQTTAAQCGIYVVGAVSGGVAALTRALEWEGGSPVRNGAVVNVSEGAIFAGSAWKAMATGAKNIGTDDPLFYPRVCKGTLTLAAGTKTLGSAEGLFVFSTTTSSVSALRNTANTSTSTTGGYAAPVASRVVGKSGTGAVVIRAEVAAGTINNADVSTIDWLVTNW